MFLERSLDDPPPPPPHFKHLSLLPPPHPPPLPPPKNFDCTPVLFATLSSNESDSHMLASMISSNFFLTLLITSPKMGTGVSAPEALVLICAINDLFCYNRIGWRRGCVSGMSGVCLWREFTFQRSKSATEHGEIKTPLHLILEAER